MEVGSVIQWLNLIVYSMYLFYIAENIIITVFRLNLTILVNTPPYYLVQSKWPLPFLWQYLRHTFTTKRYTIHGFTDVSMTIIWWVRRELKRMFMWSTVIMSPHKYIKTGTTLHLLYSAVIYWYWSGCKTWLKVRLTNSRSIIIRANKEFDIELLSMLGIFGDIFSNAHNEWRTVHKIEHYLSIYLIIRQIRDKEFVDMSNDIWQKWKSVCIDRHSLGLRADFETKIPPWQGEL